MLKARRQDNPSNFVLLEESVTATVSTDSPSGAAALTRPAFLGGTRHTTRTRRRALADDDNVYGVQSAWRSEAGKLMLMERSQVPANIANPGSAGPQQQTQVGCIQNKTKRASLKKVNTGAHQTVRLNVFVDN